MSDIRFNQWLHNSGTGGVSQVDGGHVGIGTTNPLIPVGAGVTAVLNVGVVTANSYYGSGANLTGIVGSATSLSFNDNIGAYWGNTQDLKIHHDGNHSYIDDQGTGNLRLRSGTLEITNLASNKTSALFSSGGGQTLNFNNNTKFVTTNTGAVVTGILTATKLHANSATNTAANFKGSGGAGFIQITDGDDGTLAFIGVDGGTLKFETSGSSYSDKLTISPAGLVGIGTAAGSSSSTRLVVYEESGNAQTIEIKAKNTGGVGSQPGIRFTAPNNDNIGAVYGDVNTDSLKFATGTTERLRIASDGTTAFFAPNVAWHEGPAVLEASNGYAEIFFRSTGSTHGTSITGTWGLGKLAGTDGFGLLKNSMTGGGAVRADAVFSSDNSGYMTFGKTTRSPKQIRFLVRAGRDGDGYTNNPYQFHTVIQNENSGFSGGWDATGKTKFTAPVTGFYYFSTHAAYGQLNVSFGTRILRYNSSNVLQDTYELYRFIQGSAGSHYGGSGSIAMPLDVGDYVLLQPQYTPYHLNSTLNFFSGFLIG